MAQGPYAHIQTEQPVLIVSWSWCGHQIMMMSCLQYWLLSVAAAAEMRRNRLIARMKRLILDSPGADPADDGACCGGGDCETAVHRVRGKRNYACDGDTMIQHHLQPPVREANNWINTYIYLCIRDHPPTHHFGNLAKASDVFSHSHTRESGEPSDERIFSSCHTQQET